MPAMASDPRNSRVSVHHDHLKGLTGLRGAAAWWVVLFHFREYFPPALPGWFTTFCANGYLAVDLFFILSGFIISYNYLENFHSLNARRHLHFIGLRLARVYPLHLFMLVVFLINPLAIFLQSHTYDFNRYDPIYFVLSIFLVQNWGFTHSVIWNVPAWSISTEWFAYIIFPLTALFVNLVPRGRLPQVIGFLLPLGALAAGLYLAGDTLGSGIEKTGLLRCVAEFTAGMFLFRLWREAGHQGYFRVGSALIAVGLLTIYAISGLADFWIVPAAWGGLILAVATGQRAWCFIFNSRWMQLIGAWSYSTYLLHYFVRDWVKFLLIHGEINSWLPLATYLGVTLAGSVLLYRHVEVPGRRALRHRVDALAG